MSQLYSFKGQDPKEIPNRIRLSDGTTKTDRTTFTADDLTDAGFTGPYTLQLLTKIMNILNGIHQT